MTDESQNPGPEESEDDDHEGVGSMSDQNSNQDEGVVATAESHTRDAFLILGIMLGIYVVYALAGVLLGYSVNGLANTLQRVTFLTAVYAMLTLALNLQWGYTGLFNIGITGFMAVGVYTMAMFTRPPLAASEELPLGFGIPGLGMPLIVGIIAGMVAAAILGFVISLPALRLRADYLAIVTIAMAEIVRLTYQSSTFQNVQIQDLEIPLTNYLPFLEDEIVLFSPDIRLGTGGGAGISTPDNPVFAIFYNNPGNISEREPNFIGDIIFPFFESLGIGDSVVISWAYALVLVVFVAAFYWILRRIGFSPFGRVLKAIREDEEATNSLGKDTNMYKIKVFMLGCSLMGLAGILWYGSQGNVNPTRFLPQVTFFIWIALIIGGSTSNTGSVMGAALFSALLLEGPRYVRTLIDQADFIELGDTPQTFADALGTIVALDSSSFLAYVFSNLSSLRIVLMGVVLIWLMQNRPDGLLGHRKEIAASIDLTKPASGTATDGGRIESPNEGGEEK